MRAGISGMKKQARFKICPVYRPRGVLPGFNSWDRRVYPCSHVTALKAMPQHLTVLGIEEHVAFAARASSQPPPVAVLRVSSEHHGCDAVSFFAR